VSLALITGILSIIIINIILSGDNAVVIAMASRRLPPTQRKRAIIYGGAGAIVLRIVFTAIASVMLRIPLLQTVGGLALVWVSWRLLREEGGEQEIDAATTVWGAFQTILLADFLMSLDNILAIGGASHGSFSLLLFGLLASMPIILIGSSFIATLMNRFPWLSIVGAIILTITAARMVVDDHFVRDHIAESAHLLLVIVLAVIFTIVAVGPSVVAQRRTEMDG
jgi:YjbE family integral membrane protein